MCLPKNGCINFLVKVTNKLSEHIISMCIIDLWSPLHLECSWVPIYTRVVSPSINVSRITACPCLGWDKNFPPGLSVGFTSNCVTVVSAFTLLIVTYCYVTSLRVVLVLQIELCLVNC